MSTDNRPDLILKQSLKNAVETKFGSLVLSFGDCQCLVVRLQNEGLFLSAHTIARFYGLLKGNKSAYNSTLNLLCQFIGLSSFKEFEELQRSRMVCPRLEKAWSLPLNVSCMATYDIYLVTGHTDGFIKVWSVGSGAEFCSKLISEVSISNIVISGNNMFCLDADGNLFKFVI